MPYLVLSSGLVPDSIGIYFIELYVPGDHIEGDDLRVVITSADVSSPFSSPLAAVR